MLATVVEYWHQRTGKGDRVTPEQIVPEIYSRTARGVLGIDMGIRIPVQLNEPRTRSTEGMQAFCETTSASAINGKAVLNY